GSRSQMRSTSSEGAIVATRSGCCSELAALRPDPFEELRERVREFLHALLLEGEHDVVVVDAGRREVGEELPGLGDAVEDRVAAHLAVVLEGADRLLR